MNLGIRFNNATTLQIPLKTVQWCMKKLAFVFFSLQFIVRSHAIVCQLSYQTTVEKCSSLFFSFCFFFHTTLPNEVISERNGFSFHFFLFTLR